MDTTLSRLAANVPELVILLAFAVFGVPLLCRFINRALRRFDLTAALRHLIVSVVRMTAYILIFLALLYSLGLTGIAATLSGSVLLIGVALGQAFKDLLTDVIAGFAMARDKDFNVGFKIKIGETTGVIKDIGLRKIRLIDEDGRLRVLANSGVEKSEWVILDRNLEPNPKKASKSKS